MQIDKRLLSLGTVMQLDPPVRFEKPSEFRYSAGMATDITQVQLSDAERRLLSEVANRAGKPWSQVFNEALRQYDQSAPPAYDDAPRCESWYHRLSRHRLIGCLHGAPADLSTNPVYMEGFGLSDH